MWRLEMVVAGGKSRPDEKMQERSNELTSWNYTKAAETLATEQRKERKKRAAGWNRDNAESERAGRRGM